MPKPPSPQWVRDWLALTPADRQAFRKAKGRHPISLRELNQFVQDRRRAGKSSKRGQDG